MFSTQLKFFRVKVIIYNEIIKQYVKPFHLNEIAVFVTGSIFFRISSTDHQWYDYEGIAINLFVYFIMCTLKGIVWNIICIFLCLCRFIRLYTVYLLYEIYISSICEHVYVRFSIFAVIVCVLCACVEIYITYTRIFVCVSVFSYLEYLSVF